MSGSTKISASDFDGPKKVFKQSSSGMGHLDAGVPILGGARSDRPALDTHRWGKVLCRVQISEDSATKDSDRNDEDWNFAMTDSTICLFTNDGENCKLFPRKTLQMVDLEDTDEVVVKVSKLRYYSQKVLGTLLIIGIIVSLDEFFGYLYGAGVLESLIPADIYANLSSYTSPWWLLVLLPIVPLIWCLVGCCVHPPYADIFKGSKLTLVTGHKSTTFRMADDDLPNIQEFLDNPSGTLR
mmetsp:Transcript_19443/g.52590  ORF Transcript_19443/g.52590 Transcript_19443/m.52590 type:complete len:240 (+) Transcript_19443:60-779(+)